MVVELEFRHLRYFVAIAEEGSFNQASLRLHISQPTLSRQIRELEERLGVALLRRTQSGVVLTESGMRFLEGARSLLGGERALVASLQPCLRVGYMAASLAGPVGVAIQEFRGRGLQLVEATPGVQLEMLLAGALEVAFLGNFTAPVPDDVELRFLFEIPLAAVVPVSHRLAARSCVILAELAGEPFVGLQPETFPGRTDFMTDACREAGFEPEWVQLADGLASLLALVGSGVGLTLIPREASSLPHPQSVFVPLEEPAPVIRFCAGVRQGNRCPYVRELLESVGGTGR